MPRTTQIITIYAEHDPEVWGQLTAASALAHEVFGDVGATISTARGLWEGNVNWTNIVMSVKPISSASTQLGLTWTQTKALKEWLYTNKQESALVIVQDGRPGGTTTQELVYA